jgi:hypothetical protein
MSATVTMANLKSKILTHLGMPVVQVELIDDQLTECINHALGVYGKYRPLHKLAKISVVTGQTAYVLTTYGKGIIDVMYEDPLLITAELSELDLWRYNQFSTLATDPGDYYAAKLWRNEVKRAVGSDFDWEYDYNTHTLYVSGIPTSASGISYIYVENPTLATVSESDDDMVFDLAVSKAKQILGRIRSKFGGIPGAEAGID